jgi:aryl-alcohol dehydrogenase-like predicted oxidoreductase
MSQQKASAFGFGTYRVSCHSPEQMAALRLALKNGIRVIDTSTNYMDGDSESAIGEILKDTQWDHLESKPLIISKAGYAQGSVLETAKTKNYSEMTQLSPDLWHCISPDFLSDRLSESLSRLPYVDYYLLHNPEYFLKATPDHHEYYKRIANAFRHLEKECANGRIQGYGVSSNTFIEQKEHPHFTSLEVLMEIAEEIAAEQKSPHHFKVVQFPFNLFENEAYSLNQYTGGLNLFELASKYKLFTLINRPLNAFTPKHLVRLANYPHHHGIPLESAIQKTLAQVVLLESELPQDFTQSSKKPLFWGHILKDQLKHLIDIEQWKQIEAYRIWPSLMDLQASMQNASGAFDFIGWWEKYQIAMQAALLSITYWLENEASMRSERLKVKLNQAVPKLKTSPTLSSAVLRIYHSIEGVDCVLVGMRKETYVEDVLRAQADAILTAEECADALEVASEYLSDFSQ